MLYSIVLLAALLAIASCKSVNKREIGRDTNPPAFGDVVQPHQAHLFRYQVAVGTKCGQHCGGVIISERLVLTAAHCLFGTDPRTLTIKAGITFVDDKNAQVAEVASVRIHRNYVPPTSKNDIALLLLQEPLNLTNLTVATLAEAGEDFVDEIFEASGWGGTRNLTYVHYKVIKAPTCDHMSQLCGIPINPNKRVRHGDSGGPAVIRRGKEVILIGLAKSIDTHDTFTHISNLRPWIDEAITQILKTAKIIDRYVAKLPHNRCYMNYI